MQTTLKVNKAFLTVKQPNNYFAEIEQAAFSPSNMVPGVAMTPDPSKFLNLNWTAAFDHDKFL